MKYIFLFFLYFVCISASSEEFYTPEAYEIGRIEKSNWENIDTESFYVLSAGHIEKFKPVAGLNLNYIYHYTKENSRWAVNIGNISDLQFFSLPDDDYIAPDFISELDFGKYAVVTNVLGEYVIFKNKDGEFIEFGNNDRDRKIKKELDSNGESVWRFYSSKRDFYDFDSSGQLISFNIVSGGIKRVNYYYDIQRLRVVGVKNESGDGYELNYNNAQLSSIVNTVTKSSVHYKYDEFGRVVSSSFINSDGSSVIEQYLYQDKKQKFLMTAMVSIDNEIIFESRMDYKKNAIESRDVRYTPIENITYSKPVFEFMSDGQGSVIDRAEKRYYITNSSSTYLVSLPLLLAEKSRANQNWAYLSKQILIDNTQQCLTCTSRQEINWSSFGNILNNNKFYLDGREELESYYYDIDDDIGSSYKKISINGKFTKSEFWSGKVGQGRLLQENTPELILFYTYDDSGELLEITVETEPAVKPALSRKITGLPAFPEVIEQQNSFKDDLVTIQAGPAAPIVCATSPACVAAVVRTGQFVVNGVAVTFAMLMEYWNRERRSYDDCADDCSAIINQNNHPRPKCWASDGERSRKYDECLRVCQEGGDHWKIILGR